MNAFKKFTLVAALACAASSAVYAQAGPGGGVGTGDGTGGAAGTSGGGAGTTGWLAIEPTMSARGRLITSSRILPADGSNTEASTTALAAAQSTTVLGGPSAPAGERDVNIMTK
jgi:hypothetical protein